MYFKKIISIMFIFVIVTGLFALSVTANDNIRVLFNDEELHFDVPPQIINGRTMVPVRKIFEKFGAKVIWYESLRIVDAKIHDTVFSMRIGDSYLSITNYEEDDVKIQELALDVPPQLVGGRTLVPLRTIAEAMEAKVDWNEETKTVSITTKSKLEFDNRTYEPMKLFIDGVELTDTPALLGHEELKRVCIPLYDMLKAMGATVETKDVSYEEILSDVMSYDDYSDNLGAVSLWKKATESICFDYGGKSFVCSVCPRDDLKSISYSLMWEEKYRYSGDYTDVTELLLYRLKDNKMYICEYNLKEVFEKLMCSVDIDKEGKTVKINRRADKFPEVEIHSLDEFMFIKKGMSAEEVKKLVGEPAYSDGFSEDIYALKDDYELRVYKTFDNEEIAGIDLIKHTVFGITKGNRALFNDDGTLKIQDGKICFEQEPELYR